MDKPETFDKPFKTYDDMIKLLKSRNLIINDNEFTKKALSDFSYYTLINGYKDTFLQINGTDNYIDGLSFDDLYNINRLDNSLNHLIFKYILLIERSLKSKIAYRISEQYGVFTDYTDFTHNNPDDYLYIDNYSKSKHANKKRFNILTKIKEQILEYKKSPIIQHYLTTKNHMPAWIIINILTFGLTKEWYSILKSDDKTEICNQFIILPIAEEQKKEFFKKSLDILREYRNKIAHGNRTFSIVGLPELPKAQVLRLSYGTITTSEYNKGIGKHDFFSIFLIILSLINDSKLIHDFAWDFDGCMGPFREHLFAGKSVYEILGLPIDFENKINILINAKLRNLHINDVTQQVAVTIEPHENIEEVVNNMLKSEEEAKEQRWVASSLIDIIPKERLSHVIEYLQNNVKPNDS